MNTKTPLFKTTLVVWTRQDPTETRDTLATLNLLEEMGDAFLASADVVQMTQEEAKNDDGTAAEFFRT